MKDYAEIVIIGGGVMGLSLAYHFARMGFIDIVVLEQGYLCSGASGRNGGGVRQQWSTEENVLLMKDSVRMYRKLVQETGYNIWFRQGGYLFLARDAYTASELEKNVQTQNHLGVRTKLLSPEKASHIVNGLNTKGIEVCAYNSRDGVLFPWPVLWGMARVASRLGVDIETFTRVIAIDTKGSRVDKVVTSRGSIATTRVVNAAGAWSGQIARMVGIELPNKPYRHEILITEPLKPFLNPMVSDLSNGTYFSQTMRGEILGGISDPDEPSSMETNSSFRFLNRMCSSMIRILPCLAGVKVMRQWAGYYDETPDGQPILGRTKGVSGFVQFNGFGGHGLMMAPAIGKKGAEWMLRRKEHEIFHKYNLERFNQGKSQTKKETFVVG